MTRLILALNRPNIPLELVPCAHDLVTAAETAELKVHSRAQNQPTLFAAGMDFFHRKNVANFYIHAKPSLFLDIVPIGFRRQLGFVVAVIVIPRVFELIRQVLLLNPVVWEAMRVFIILLALVLR